MLPYIYPFGMQVSVSFLMGVAGTILATVVALHKRHAFGLTAGDVLRIAAFVCVGAIVGAKFLFSVRQIFLYGSNADFWTASNWRSILTASGGFYGGFFGGLGMAFLGAKRNHVEMKNVFGLGSYAALGYSSLGRLGCLFTGYCYGVVLPSGVQFPYPLAEASFCALLLLGFLRWNPNNERPDNLFPLYLLTYSIGRFILEFFRGDESRGVCILSTSQWIALVLIAAAILWLRKLAKANHLAAAPSAPAT
jgi:phosphatidylglycerol:prolipoprotein diacylglycerol transferase